MVFEIRLLPSAEKDLENALEYYHQINDSLSKRFYLEFLALHSILEQNPFFEVKYNSVRTYTLKSFPYSVHFVVDKEANLVVIIAVIFGKQGKFKFEERLSDI